MWTHSTAARIKHGHEQTAQLAGGVVSHVANTNSICVVIIFKSVPFKSVPEIIGNPPSHPSKALPRTHPRPSLTHNHRPFHLPFTIFYRTCSQPSLTPIPNPPSHLATVPTGTQAQLDCHKTATPHFCRAPPQPTHPPISGRVQLPSSIPQIENVGCFFGLQLTTSVPSPDKSQTSK